VSGVLLPVVIIVVVAIPVLIIAFWATQKSKAAGEHPVPEDAATRQRTEDEFAQAEAYQEQWREEEKKHPRDTII
jgi:FtsZ-interacting cell division protein ZipA